MPPYKAVKSKAQSRKLFALAAQGKISEAEARGKTKAANFSKLPQHVKKKKSKSVAEKFYGGSGVPGAYAVTLTLRFSNEGTGRRQTRERRQSCAVAVWCSRRRIRSAGSRTSWVASQPEWETRLLCLRHFDRMLERAGARSTRARIDYCSDASIANGTWTAVFVPVRSSFRDKQSFRNDQMRLKIKQSPPWSIRPSTSLRGY
jgi:hypothetical protein